MLLLKQIHMNGFLQLMKSNHKLVWKTGFATAKLIVKIYNFGTYSSPDGLFPFPFRLKSMKLKKYKAKATV